MASPLARDIRTLPNLITLSRIALLIVAISLYLTGSRGLAIILAVVAGVTDTIDGIVARATGQVTRLGEILDQFSDLFFESTVLVIVVVERFLPPIIIVLYLFREFWVLSIRRFMAAHQLNIASSALGKLKTNLVMWSFLPTFLSVFALLPSAEPWLSTVGRCGIAAGILTGYVSAWRYTRQFVAGYNAVSTKR